MGPRLQTRLAAPILALAVLGAAATADAAKPAKTPPAVESKTGDSAELIQRVPIAKRAGARDRVAMRLDPATFEPIAAGDRLRAAGEVQVSTTCVDPGKRCVGRPYDINPKVTARIVLSASPKVTPEALALSPPRTVLCKQQRPNRNHHCTIAVPNTEVVIPDPAALPCEPSA